ncbi:cell surface glycoprotein CD200 receptor 5-like [Acomys russatus]|uniref:cell surface glycoprotein CD200 receptor 5-like n=1 Tax=Acomys russatus TaxID=60746 RepID=UPI0021E2C56A|nr:cell surface glycoprotein CD200 receptor 5-like [Acomys russatus]
MCALQRIPALLLLIFTTILVSESRCTDRNQMTQNSSSFIAEVNTTLSVQMGTKALLCCPAIPLTKAILITWTIAPRGQPSSRIAYKVDTKETHETNCTDKRITWASTPDQNSDLQINEVALEHDGYYSCEIGATEMNLLERYDLKVLVPPEVTLVFGGNRTAACEAIAGKPAAQIFWTPHGNCATKNTSHSNGTVTVRSTCYWEQDNVSAVVCFVSHSAGNHSLSLEMNGPSESQQSLLTILYVKLGLLGITLLTVGFAFCWKQSDFR